MIRRISSFLAAFALAVCLLIPCADTAHAGDLDYIHNYDITGTPNTNDGSLHIQVDLRWEVLDEGPVTWLQIGIPNGSIRNVQALSDTIDDLSYDNSFMYVYLDRGYDDGEIFEFSYSWDQEYMYTLSGDTVSYDYTPGWFDSARIGEMRVTWNAPVGATQVSMDASATNNSRWTETTNGNSYVCIGQDLSHGERLNIVASYQNWPTPLLWENSSENLPQDDYDYDYDSDYDYSADVMSMLFSVIVMVIVIVIVVNVIANSSYHGGFGTPRYVCWHGLWYPAGWDGRPKPGSVGTKTKPKTPPRKPPTRSSGGGFGGGSRGGGFGGGGFGGGSHCACASSCACACACACAGGGRAGCSAKNLYGAVQLDRELTQTLTEE